MHMSPKKLFAQNACCNTCLNLVIKETLPEGKCCKAKSRTNFGRCTIVWIYVIFPEITTYKLFNQFYETISSYQNRSLLFSCSTLRMKNHRHDKMPSLICNHQCVGILYGPFNDKHMALVKLFWVVWCLWEIRHFT